MVLGCPEEFLAPEDLAMPSLNCYFSAAHSSLELESFSLEALSPVLLGGQIPMKYGDKNHLGQPWEQPSTHWLNGVKGGCRLLTELSGSVAWETYMLDDHWLLPASLWTSVPKSFV